MSKIYRILQDEKFYTKVLIREVAKVLQRRGSSN
jgi:hypothetical protein